MAAVEPINRRQQAALEALQRRATQANDLDTALKIKEALQKLPATTTTVSGISSMTVESLTSRLIGTTWVYFRGETLTFLADGKGTMEREE